MKPTIQEETPMRLKRLLAGLVAAVVVIAFASAGALAQAAPQGKDPVVKPPPRGLQVTLQVKVKNMKAMGGYYVQGTTEVYQLANPNPEVLEPLFKSGETVTIEASASGDLLTIQTLNGKKYEGKPAPASK
jgi:hypothetical protein